MTTLSELYNNIKTFVLQAFEGKEEEYINLSNEVVEIIQYIDGEIVVFDSPVMILKINGQSLTMYSSSSMTPNDIFISYGDGSSRIYSGDFSHNYEESGEYTVRMKGVTSLGSDCFRNCTNLISISIPHGIRSLGSNCFYGCSRLASVSIPSGVNSIGAYCFGNCGSLTSISIPIHVISIGNYCFYRCTRLTNIKLNWEFTDEILSYSSNWISNANANLKFTIPAGTTSRYVAKGYPSSKLVEASD